MWDKLYALLHGELKDKPVREDIRIIAPNVEEMGGSSSSLQRSSNAPDGPSTQIGYNYLKGLDNDAENNNKHMRRFINLNKLLRGTFDGQTTTTSSNSEKLRGEDS